MPVSVATTTSLAALGVLVAVLAGVHAALGLARIFEHAAGGEHVHALAGHVAGGDVLHHARRAAALGVDQEVGVGVRGARGFDVGGADAGVHVALAVPHVHRRPSSFST